MNVPWLNVSLPVSHSLEYIKHKHGPGTPTAVLSADGSRKVSNGSMQLAQELGATFE